MSDRSRRSSRSTKLSPKATLVVIGLLVGYVLLQPSLERWTGIDLPSLTGDGQLAPQEPPPLSADVDDISLDDVRSTGPTAEHELPRIVPGHSDEAPPVIRSDREKTATAETHEAGNESVKPETPQLGELRDIGGGVFQSTAGLTYRRGSQEGHRIKHILRHHEDDRDRPVHGVFDGDRNEVFAVIDEAYLYTFDHGPPRVKTEDDDGRTIYIVDLGRRIGYVGGEKGQRNNHPAANHLQLILDGTNVITAYPVRVDRHR